jgi:hypothetical protein
MASDALHVAALHLSFHFLCSAFLILLVCRAWALSSAPTHSSSSPFSQLDRGVRPSLFRFIPIAMPEFYYFFRITSSILLSSAFFPYAATLFVRFRSRGHVDQRLRGLDRGGREAPVTTRRFSFSFWTGLPCYVPRRRHVIPGVAVYYVMDYAQHEAWDNTILRGEATLVVAPSIKIYN